MKDQLSMIEGYEYDPPSPMQLASENRKFKKPVEMFGLGPTGKTCKTCKHRFGNTRNKTWYKCEKWHISSSIATDIRLKWPACGKYEMEKAE